MVCLAKHLYSELLSQKTLPGIRRRLLLSRNFPGYHLYQISKTILRLILKTMQSLCSNFRLLRLLDLTMFGCRTILTTPSVRYQLTGATTMIIIPCLDNQDSSLQQNCATLLMPGIREKK